MASRDQLRRSAHSAWRRLPHPLRWVGVALVGGSLLLIGVALLVLPGPGLLFIALGLLVLASEFVWAQTLLHRVKRRTGALSTAVLRRGRLAAPSSDARH